MKKFLALLLALLMVFSLAACGDGETQESQGAETSQTPTNTDAGTQESSEPAAPVEAEPIDYTPLIHLDFETTDGLTAVIQTSDVGDNDGANYGIIASNHPITLAEGQGAVGNALYLDGKYGVSFDMVEIDDDSYTISFWYNADRLSTYGPIVQMGRNVGHSNATSTVTWINFTQTEWGTSNAKICPLVWNRNSSIGTEVSDDGVWPWTCAYDDEVHGKREWCLVTLVVDGVRYTCADDSMDRIGSSLYINGELVHEANSENLWYQGVSPEIFASADGLEGFIGINYWDTVFKGFVDELYVYDEALTAGQVKTLYEQGNPPASPVAPETPDYEDEGGITEPDEPETLPAAPVDDSAIATLGTTDRVLGWWTDHTNGYELKEGATLTMKLNNYSSGVSNWHNFVLAFTNTAVTADLIPSAENYDGYAEYAVMRADAFGWGDASYAATFDTTWGDDWAGWLKLMTEAKVDITITRSGSDITIDYTFTGADGTVMTEKAVVTSTLTADAPCYVHVGGESAYIELLSVN